MELIGLFIKIAGEAVKDIILEELMPFIDVRNSSSFYLINYCDIIQNIVIITQSI